MNFEQPKQIEEVFSDPDDGNEIHLLAIIIRNNFTDPGIKFFTEPEASQQVAFIRYEKGHVIKPHSHPAILRKITQTREVLVIRRGILRAEFYDFTGRSVAAKYLYTGDLLLLIQGGHGFQVVEEVEMYEIKQGPYVGELDKVYIGGK
jgi:mannose-6-phosphate isomerase-like protein (cupin superfamily)